MTTLKDRDDYQKYKQMAKDYNQDLDEWRKENGLEIKDVLAMSPQNDPFWMTVGKIYKARWAFRIMENVIKPHMKRINADDIHLRDIHYILTGIRGGYPTWNDEAVYQNTEADWSNLLDGFANARYLGLVDPQLIRDNKNKYEKRKKYNQDKSFEKSIDDGKNYLNKEEILDLFVYWFKDNKNWHNYAPVHIELWAEKDLALLEQVAEKYDIDTVVGEGEISITQVYRIVDRIKRVNKPIRIGYVADADVVGTNMSKAMSRKLEFILQKIKEEGIDVKVTHLMLDPTQVHKYNLPTIPMKKGKKELRGEHDSYKTRKDDWKQKRGLKGAVEINSFHALHPNDFRTILETFILSYYDEEIKEEIEDFNKDRAEAILDLVSNDDKINALLDKSIKGLHKIIDGIDWLEQETEYNEAFSELLDYHENLDYSEADEHYQWLLDSMIGYSDQLDRYTDYEDGKIDNPIVE